VTTRGKKRLGLLDPSGDNSRKVVLVIEDSPAGIRAGKAADCQVLGLITSHTLEQVAAAGPDWIVKDLASVKVVGSGKGSVTLQFANTTHQR
jgi:glycerol-1-phosphatase